MKINEYLCAECKNTFLKNKDLVANPDRTFCCKECKKLYFQKLCEEKRKNRGKSKICSCGGEKDLRSKKCVKCEGNEHQIKTGSVTDKQIIKAVKENKSIRQVAKKLKISRKTIIKKIDELHLDISHFTYGKTRPMPEEELFSLSPVSRNIAVKRKLYSNGTKQKKCDICGQGSIWQGKQLSLELHHIDGNNRNNNIENLQILCPNCHTQTPTSKKKNKKTFMEH